MIPVGCAVNVTSRHAPGAIWKGILLSDYDFYTMTYRVQVGDYAQNVHAQHIKLAHLVVELI